MELFRRPVAIALEVDDSIVIRRCSSQFAMDALDADAAIAAVRSGIPAGQGTAQVANAFSRFVPLLTLDSVVGSLGFKDARGSRESSFWESNLFSDFITQTALAVLRGKLYEQVREAARARQEDHLRNALLNSVSHDFRTPLASIVGALSLMQDAPVLDETTRRELLESARAEAERLNRSLTNLLDMGRLEAGATCLRLEPCDVQDVIGSALEQLRGVARARAIRVTIPEGLPFVRMDFALIVQVLVNLLDNAIKYSPSGSTIDLQVRAAAEELEFSVLDQGEGIPESGVSHLFEKFNRAGRSGDSGGIGLGLAICKGLVEAHRGRIWMQTRAPSGTLMRFVLPVQGLSGDGL